MVAPLPSADPDDATYCWKRVLWNIPCFSEGGCNSLGLSENPGTWLKCVFYLKY